MPRAALRIARDTDKALPKRFNFTMANLQRLACPAGKDRLYVYDDRTPHLALAVTASGSKSFYFVAKVQTRVSRFRLGGFPEINVDTARKLAAKHSATTAAGEDPAEARRAARGALTLGELWEDYKAKHADTHNSPRTQLTDENRYQNHLQEWASRRVNKITTDDCIGLHNRIAKASGTGSANRCLQMLRRLLYHAKITANPVHPKFPFFQEQKRKRYLELDEMRRFLEALDKQPDPFPDFFRLCLYTGARRGNVLAMRWEAIDFDRAIWHITAQEFKAKHPVDVPLSAEALAILNKRHAAGLSEQWVFPSHGKSGHLEDPKSAWKRIMEAAKIKDFVIHDLRHTCATWQLANGADLHTIAEILGHKDPATTARYAHVRIEGMRKSISAATAAMAAAAAPKENSDEPQK